MTIWSGSNRCPAWRFPPSRTKPKKRPSNAPQADLAPLFRTLHERYPVEDLEEPLAEGIITGQPTMPQFRFDPGQVGDVIAYLKSLERRIGEPSEKLAKPN